MHFASEELSVYYMTVFAICHKVYIMVNSFSEKEEAVIRSELRGCRTKVRRLKRYQENDSNGIEWLDK